MASKFTMAFQKTLSSHDRAKLRSIVRDVWGAQGICSWIRLIDTQSMSPSLSGDVFLLVEWGTSSNLHPGELVLFSSPHLELPVVHRIGRLRLTNGEHQIFQTTDHLVDGNFEGSWIPQDAVLGRIIAVRWGENGTKVIRLTSWPYPLLGTLLAKLSAKWWEYTNETSRSGRTLTKWVVAILHQILSYMHALSLWLGISAFQENISRQQ